MSLFDDDLGGLRKRGSLYKFSWVEEQRKSLQVLQERSLEKSTRRQVDSDASPLNLEDFRATLLSRSESARSSAEGQAMPPSAFPAPSKEIDGTGKRQSVKLSEGEVDPLSALMSGAAVADYYEEDDKAQTPPPLTSSSSGHVSEAQPSEASGAQVDVDNGIGYGSDDQESDPVVLRRAKRLVFSLTLYLVESGKLGIGISELSDGSISVSRLEDDDDGDTGPAEAAGLLVGDRLIGANYQPFRGGLTYVVELFQAAKARDVLYLQVVRDLAVSGGVRPRSQPFPAISKLLAQAAALHKQGILSPSEDRQVNAAILALMARQEETRRQKGSVNKGLDTPIFLSPVRRPIEKLSLRAKGLREAISVHCLEAEKREVNANGSTSGSVFYRLRIEDVETTQWWFILKRYRDFAALHAELVTLWPPTSELAFPAKVLAPSSRVVEDRMIALEAFLRDCVALLGVYACSDSRAGQALQTLQTFLRVPQHVDAVDPDLIMEQVLPPPLPEHRAVELVAFELLNGDSSARDEAHLLLASFHGNNIVERCQEMGDSKGLSALFREVSLRVEHLQEFMTKHHSKGLARAQERARDAAVCTPHLISDAARSARDADSMLADANAAVMAASAQSLLNNDNEDNQYGDSQENIDSYLRESQSIAYSHVSLAQEAVNRLIDRSVRRQCEAAVVLPLWRYLTPSIAPLKDSSSALQRRMRVMASPAFADKTATVLQVPLDMPLLAPIEWSKAKAAVVRLCAQLLPYDMIDALLSVSQAVVALHGAVGQAKVDAASTSGGHAPQVEDVEEVEEGGVEESVEQSESSSSSSSSGSGSGAALSAMSADDFLPLLTLVMVHAMPPDLTLVAELCSQLLDPEEAISERGYYVASLQASVRIAENLEVEGLVDACEERMSEAGSSPLQPQRTQSITQWMGGGRKVSSSNLF